MCSWDDDEREQQRLKNHKQADVNLANRYGHQDCKECGNYIDDTFMNVNCQGCTNNPFYINCFTQKEKPIGNKCIFNMAWVGECGKATISKESRFCAEHSKIKCGCGKQAVKTCSATIGSFVCGRPLCGGCRCHH